MPSPPSCKVVICIHNLEHPSTAPLADVMSRCICTRIVKCIPTSTYVASQKASKNPFTLAHCRRSSFGTCTPSPCAAVFYQTIIVSAIFAMTHGSNGIGIWWVVGRKIAGWAQGLNMMTAAFPLQMAVDILQYFLNRKEDD